MILDNRQLVFSESAVLTAFRWYVQAQGQSDLPQGVVSRIALTGTPCRVTVFLQRHGASRFDEFPFSGNKLVGALLYFCKKQKVPVPRDAQKTLRVEDDVLVMDITRQIVATPPA
ncbi:MAG: hypothetical protein WCO00_16965 [Rhodospirillaceae bacterium]